MKKLVLSLILIVTWNLSVLSENIAPGMERYKTAPYSMHLTKDTKWIEPGKKFNFYNTHELTDVYAGVFGCQINGFWAFYNINGEKIFDAEWSAGYNRGEIKFTDGVCLMWRKGEKNLSLLRKDGTYKKLPDYYFKPTNFVDGIAMVYSNKSGVERNVYINTEGEEVYKNIKFVDLGGYDSKNSSVVPPLKDGLRLFKDSETNLFGYFDKDGKVVIPPRFTEARSFNDGMALVREKDSPLFFIDTHGKKAFEPAWNENTFNYSLSDFNDGMCVFYGDNGNIYYDKAGVKVMELPQSSIPFYGGYAWYSEIRGDIYDYVVNTRQEKYKAQVSILITYTPVTPDFSPSGIAIIDNGYTAVTPNGHILIKSEELSNRFFWFSPDHITQAEFKINGEEYYGFMNEFGEIIVVLK